MQLKLPFIFLLFACLLAIGVSQENQKMIKGKDTKKVQRAGRSGINKAAKRASEAAKKTKDQTKDMKPKNDIGCTSVGGICQRESYVCQGRYLKDKCSGTGTRQCCLPGGAWNVFCAGHHNNRVRACDRFGCGGFNSKSEGGIHKAVDIVCGDYGIINAPFTGNLGGPVGRKVGESVQYDGIKLSNSVHCVKIFNIRPYRYTGAVERGEALGYLLPLQDQFSGITSHLELQMCDLSDPSPFI